MAAVLACVSAASGVFPYPVDHFGGLRVPRDYPECDEQPFHFRLPLIIRDTSFAAPIDSRVAVSSTMTRSFSSER